MQNLTKREIVLKIVEEKPNLTQLQIVAIVQKIFDKITDALATGQNVELRNFGVFEVVLRRQKSGRNPMNPQITIPVPARARVKFSAGKVMRERILKLTETMQQPF